MIGASVELKCTRSYFVWAGALPNEIRWNAPPRHWWSERVMRIFGIIVVGIALLIGGGVIFYWVSSPAFTYRYRMTVEVDVDGVARSASSVIQVVLQKQSSFPGPLPPFVSHVTGEAVYVDLGGKLNIIAILGGGPGPKPDVDYPYYIVPTLIRQPVGTIEDAKKLERLRGVYGVPVALWPMFISYSNPDDPKSAHTVKSQSVIDGRVVVVKAVTIEMTADPIVWSIANRLPWIEHADQYLSIPGNPFSDTLQFGKPHLSRR
jgi:spore coat protein CotH